MLHSLRKSVLFTILSVVMYGCSDTVTTDESARTTTYKDNRRVVSGMVYGYPHGSLVSVSCGVWPKFLYLSAGQFAFVNLSTTKPNAGKVFSASFTDGRQLYSYWTGTETRSADITETVLRSGHESTYSMRVDPVDPSATVNINPVTNLAYWLWQNNSQYPYSDYLGNVFQFLRFRFPQYNLPIQNALKDVPAPELQHLLDDIDIDASGDATEYSLISASDGKIICTGSFASFPICLQRSSSD